MLNTLDLQLQKINHFKKRFKLSMYKSRWFSKIIIDLTSRKKQTKGLHPQNSISSWHWAMQNGTLAYIHWPVVKPVSFMLFLLTSQTLTTMLSEDSLYIKSNFSPWQAGSWDLFLLYLLYLTDISSVSKCTFVNINKITFFSLSAY